MSYVIKLWIVFQTNYEHIIRIHNKGLRLTKVHRLDK